MNCKMTTSNRNVVKACSNVTLFILRFLYSKYSNFSIVCPRLRLTAQEFSGQFCQIYHILSLLKFNPSVTFLPFKIRQIPNIFPSPLKLTAETLLWLGPSLLSLTLYLLVDTDPGTRPGAGEECQVRDSLSQIYWVFIAGSTNSGSLLKHEPGQTISSASRRDAEERRWTRAQLPVTCHVSRVTCHVT